MKTIIATTLNFAKETKGTFVFDNTEIGFSGVYLPKGLFAAAGVKVSDTTKLTLAVAEKNGKPIKATPGAVLDTDLNFIKSTKGTHVLSNDDLSGIYIPKPFFAQAGPPKEGSVYHVVIVEAK